MCCVQADRYACSVISQQTNANLFRGNPFAKPIGFSTPVGVVLNTDHKNLANTNPNMTDYFYGGTYNINNITTPIFCSVTFFL